MPNNLKLLITKIAEQKGIFTFIYFVILAPVFEELIFRGIMLNGLLKRYSPLKSAVISSLLFGLVHLNPWQFIVASFIGCLFGWIFYRTKSLMPCIIIHAVANGTGFLMRVFLSPKELLDASAVLPDDIVPFGVIVVITILLLIIVYLLNEFLPERSNDF